MNPNLVNARVSEEVVCLSWYSLMKKYNISASISSDTNIQRNIHVLKVDAEGADLFIVNEALDWYENTCSGNAALPNRLLFEIQHAETEELGFLLERLHNLAYECREHNGDMDCTRKYFHGVAENEALTFPWDGWQMGVNINLPMS